MSEGSRLGGGKRTHGVRENMMKHLHRKKGRKTQALGEAVGGGLWQEEEGSVQDAESQSRCYWQTF